MKKFILVLLANLFITSISYSQEVKWMILAKGGSAYNFKTPLIIQQAEQEDIRINARYATKPFAGPPYYDIQLIRWKNDKGWGARWTHHKLYLQNNPPEVQRFTITDGYNLLTLTRQWKIFGLVCHIGGGAVLTHPESMIRGQHFSETKGWLHSGYHLSGPVAEATVEKRFDLSRKFLISLEGRITGSYVKVPVANGHAHTSNIALHGLAGIGYKFYGKK